MRETLLSFTCRGTCRGSRWRADIAQSCPSASRRSAPGGIYHSRFTHVADSVAVDQCEKAKGFSSDEELGNVPIPLVLRRLLLFLAHQELRPGRRLAGVFSFSWFDEHRGVPVIERLAPATLPLKPTGTGPLPALEDANV